jgi:hypothetical protein
MSPGHSLKSRKSTESIRSNEPAQSGDFDGSDQSDENSVILRINKNLSYNQGYYLCDAVNHKFAPKASTYNGDAQTLKIEMHPDQRVANPKYLSNLGDISNISYDDPTDIQAKYLVLTSQQRIHDEGDSRSNVSYSASHLLVQPRDGSLNVFSGDLSVRQFPNHSVISYNGENVILRDFTPQADSTAGSQDTLVKGKEEEHEIVQARPLSEIDVINCYQ